MRSKMLTVAIAAGLGLTSVSAASAQTSQKVTVSAAELAQMKAEIAALEQKVQDLQSQTDAQTQAQAQTAQQVQATQQQVAAASTQVAQAQQNASKDHSLHLGGDGGIKVTFGGFLAAESVYRSRDTGDDINSKFSNIPMLGGTSTGPINTASGATTTYPVTNARNDQFLESARQSRLSIMAQGDVTPDVHVTGYYEMDFLGGAQTANMNESNSYNLRVRQLWSNIDWDTYGLHLLAGQAWSLLTLDSVGITPTKEVLPPSIDAQYFAGFTWARQTQVRLVKDWNKQFWLGISLENPQTSGIGATTGSGTKYYSSVTGTVQAGNTYDTLNSVSLNHIPDIIVKAALDPGWGHYEVFGLSREFITRVTPLVNGVSTPTDTNNKTSHGDGFGFGTILPLVPKVLDLQLSGMSGKGIGRYGSAQLNDVTYTAQGAAQPLKENMALGTLTFHASPDFDLYVAGGREQEDSYTDAGANGKLLGYGSALLGYNNTDCLIYGAPADCTGQTRQIAEESAGFNWKFYQGKFGKVQFGMQFSHVTRQLFTDVKGNAPTAPDNMVFTSFRYYPF